MSAKILNGKVISNILLTNLSNKISAIKQNGLRVPGLAVILVGNDYSSSIYVKNKRKACSNIGMLSIAYDYPENISQQKLIDTIYDLNHDLNIDGILVQLPLPKHIDTNAIIEAIDPHKDVDGFHPFNFGKLAQNNPILRPCTPYGIMLLLAHTNEQIKSKNVAIIGSSNIVGKPMFMEFLMAGATPTICHKLTKDLSWYVRHADIVVSAAGSPNLIKGDWIKPGSIVIDVGINRLPNGSLIGDVEFEVARTKASWITPVPGGVGPMTIATLLQNTLHAYELFHKNKLY